MTNAASIAHLRGDGRIGALGALMGDDLAVEGMADTLCQRWRPKDSLVVLGNMLGPHGNPARTLDQLLLLRRRLLARPGTRACDLIFLRGAQEEMWHKALRLQFALTPLDVLDWMLARGLGTAIEAYDHSITAGRIASRNGPSAIARWTTALRARQALFAGHGDLVNGLKRAAISANGSLVFAAAGADPALPLGKQADAFWWGSRSDAALATALDQAANCDWTAITRLIRGGGPSQNDATESSRVLTVSRNGPALVALDAMGTVLEEVGP